MVFWKAHDQVLNDNDNVHDNDELQSFATGELELELPCDHQLQEQLLQQGNDISNDGSDMDDRHWKPSQNVRLVLAFIALVITGTANTVFIKLQAVPLYNYPNFVNLFGCLVFIPLTFAYIIPAANYGWFQNSITPAQWNMSKTPFLIMGALDCIATMMQLFAAVYLPGPLLVLLPQAAIPMSMIVSRHVLGQRYQILQYIGAIIVLLGIMLVLEPELSQRNAPNFLCQALNVQRDCAICQWETTQHSCLSHRLDIKPAVMTNQGQVWDFEHYVADKNHLLTFTAVSLSDDDDNASGRICEWVNSEDSTDTGERWLVLVWSGIMLLSTIPMTLSTTYKEIVLQDDMDPIFLNGWIAVFQTFYSLILMFPAGIISSPSIAPHDVPQNLYDGFQCYALGRGTIEDGCHPDTDCANAALFFNIGLVCNALYMLTCMFIIRWGSTSLLFLGLTIMVPLCNLVFCMPFMPYPATFHTSDIMGLIVIMAGLVLYRVSQKSTPNHDDHDEHVPVVSATAPEPTVAAIPVNAVAVVTASSTTSGRDKDLSKVLPPKEVVILVEPSMEDQLQEPLLPRRTGDV